MRRINKKKLALSILTVLILVLAFSIFSLERIRDDQAFMDSWKIASEREGFIEKVSVYYSPFEYLAYFIGGYFIYMIIYGWTKELFDGRLYKTLIYFLASVFGAIYSIYCYTEISKVRAILIGRGIIPPIEMLAQPFLIAIVLGLLVYLIKNSIEAEFYREASAIKDSSYYNSWKDFSRKMDK